MGQAFSATNSNNVIPSIYQEERSSNSNNIIPSINQEERSSRIKHYSTSHKILLVGEGDFSFSACLAQAFGSASNMVATSLNSIDFLSSNYGNALTNILELERRGCRVMHGVDATLMASHYDLSRMQFDRIVFNFPLAGFNSGESRFSQIARHQRLINGFFDNAKLLLAEGGEIHITHKSSGFFLEWDIVALGESSGLFLSDEEDFQLNDYPGYSNKYGFGGDLAFDCNPSKTYKFRLLRQLQLSDFVFGSASENSSGRGFGRNENYSHQVS